ncbi:MAG: DUF4010 domain-containing protein [Planctomycetaceae bacterium]|nr:DUF4010 domain-containing protein [Planctomycetaceae bacterium]
MFYTIIATLTDQVVSGNGDVPIAGVAEHPEFAFFTQLGLSLLLGLLVGLQRERSKSRLGIGMRTFPLVTVFGTICGQIASYQGGAMIFAGLICLTLIMIVPSLVESFFSRETVSGQKDGIPESLPENTGNIMKAVPGRDYGITTEVSALVMFGVGVLLVFQPLVVGVAIGGTVAVLLQFKIELHRLAERLTETDMKAIMQFVLVSFIILPVLPDKMFEWGGLNLINPWETWMMVVLIVGLGLFGYVAYMLFGRDAGIFLGGLLGGAISSTATTVSYARQAKISSAYATVAPVVIMIATAVSFVRIFIEISVISIDFFRVSFLPILFNMMLVAVPSVFLYLKIRRKPMQMPPQENPTQLKSALMFGAMYAIVTFALTAAKDSLGSSGLYVISAISGTTSMDAVTLSVSRIVAAGLSGGIPGELPGDAPVLAMQTGWRLIVVGSLANLVAKAFFVLLVADRKLFKKVLACFAVPLIGGILTILFWPA